MKKKVLFALIALFSFVSAWAVDTTPTVNVTVSGKSADLTVILKGEGLFAANGGIATLVNEGSGVTAPEAWSSGDPSTKYATQEVVDANFQKVTGKLTKEGHYFVKVTDGTKTYYVPFQVGVGENGLSNGREGVILRENVWNKQSWDASTIFSGDVYYDLFPWFDLYKPETTEPAMPEFAGNMTQAEWDGMSAELKSLYSHDWKAITRSSATSHRDVQFPQIAYRVLAEGQHKVLVQYNKPTNTAEPGNEPVWTAQWNNIVPDPDTYGQNNYWMISIPQLFSGKYPHGSGEDVITGLDENYLATYATFTSGETTIDDPKNLITSTAATPVQATTIEEALAAQFHWSDVKFSLIPAEAQYAGLYDYSWTMSPISGNYGPDYATDIKNTYITVNAFYANGDAATSGTGGDLTLVDEAEVENATPYKSYIVRFYTDAALKNQVTEVKNAGTYYVEVLVFTGMSEGVESTPAQQGQEAEPQYMSLGVEEFEIAGIQAELTLMKLEKNFGDPDPVFVDKGVAGWMYKAADGKNKTFYTLKANNQVISTSVARLVGVKFQRVDKGEEVYTSSGLGSYSYTVPLTGLKIVSPKVNHDAPYTEEEWSAIINADGTLKAGAQYTENYQILNGSFEKLHIVPRDLSLLEDDLEADDVIYNGAEYNAINKMDVVTEGVTPVADPNKVNVTGLFFTTTEGKKIQVDPSDLDNFEVTVTEGDDVDNVNVTREDGVVAPGASLTITAKPETNFTGSVTVPFTINPRNLGDFDLLADFLTKKEVTPATNPISYVVNPIKGEFQVSITGDTEFTGAEVKPEFTVVDKNRKDSTTPVALHSGETGDDAHADDYTFVYGGTNNAVSRAADGTVKDDATITITGVGNYCGTRVVNYGVKPINITDWDVALAYNDADDVLVDEETGAETPIYIYDGTEKKPTPTVSKTVTNGTETTTTTLTADDIDVTYDNNIHAGELTAKVIIKGKGNYTGTLGIGTAGNVVNDDILFSINQAELTVTANNDQKSYGDDDPDDFTWTITGWENDDELKKNTGEDKADKPWITLDEDDEEVATAVKDKAIDSELKEWLDGEIEISRATGEDNGEYVITVTGPENTGAFTGDSYNDYKITYKNGTFTVGRLGLTITPEMITRYYGQEWPESYTYTITGWDANDDVETLEAQLRAKLEEAGLTIAPVTGRTYNIGLHRETLSIRCDETQFGNYLLTYHYGDIRITAPELTIAPEDLTIKYGQKAVFKIANADELPAEIDKTKISFKAYTTDEDGELVEIKVDDEGYVREDVNMDEGYVIKTTVAGLSDDNKLGNFIINLGEGKLFVEPRPVTVTAIAQTIGYGEPLDQTQWELQPTQPTHLQTHIVNHAADADHTEAWTEIIVDVPEAGLMSGDLLGNNVKYKDNKGILLEKDPSATKVGETYEKAISIYIEDQNPNYVITKVYGDLKIVGDERIALHLNRPYLGTNYDPAEDYAENGTLWDETKPGKLVSDRVYDETLEGDDPATARDNFRFFDEVGEDVVPVEIPNTADQLLRDFDGQTVKVHFGDFNIYKDRWYTLVLPFDTKVSDVSKAFGYAVIDVLDVTNTDKTTVRFKQYIHEIPANTPFLIKVPEDINMKDVVFFAHKEYEEVPVIGEDEQPVVDEETGEAVTETKLVEKHGYKIQYKSEAQMKAAAEAFDAAAAAATASATNIPAAIKDVAGNMIIGTYLGKYGLTKNKETTIGNSGVSLLKKSAVEKAYIYPFGAYFRVADETAQGNIRLVIEEADGTLTVIDAVELAGAAEAEFAEGWYTITGIKLTSEPTVTGTYIYNGKKVFFQAK